MWWELGGKGDVFGEVAVVMLSRRKLLDGMVGNGGGWMHEYELDEDDEDGSDDGEGDDDDVIHVARELM